MCTQRDERQGASRRCRVRRIALPVASAIPLRRGDGRLRRFRFKRQFLAQRFVGFGG
jgi:hypothetical protein